MGEALKGEELIPILEEGEMRIFQIASLQASSELQSCLSLLFFTVWSIRVMVALCVFVYFFLPLKKGVCLRTVGFGGVLVLFTDKDNTYPSWSRRSGKVNCKFTVPCSAVQHPMEMSTC